VSRLEEDSEEWPDEPAEFDPNSLGPDIPTAPSVSTFSERDVPSDVASAFWAAVLFANLGLIGVSLGPMLWYFEGMARIGGGLSLIGLIALAMTYRRYWLFMNRDRPGQRSDKPDSDGEQPTGGD
jgi:hypothetical protein